MNIRKWLCRRLKIGSWLWFKADCKRYLPAPPPGPPPIPDEPVPDPVIPQAIAGPPYIGLSIYHLITYSYGEILWYLDKLVEAGGNFTEIFGLFSWYYGWRWQPWEYRADSTWPDYPYIWDLENDSPMIWGKLAFIIKACRDRNITLSIRHHDFCSMKKPEDMKRLAFRANEQRLFQNKITGGLWGIPIQEWYRECWIKPLMAILRTAPGAHVFHVPMNEADYVFGAGDTQADADAAVIRFHDFYFAELARHFAQDRMIISTSRCYDELRTRYLSRMEIHGVSSPEAMAIALSKYRDHKIFLNGDGPDPYAKGDVGDTPNKRMPSVNQAEQMGQMIALNDLWGWCGINRCVEAPGNQGMSSAQFYVVVAMRYGYNRHSQDYPA